MIYLRRLNSKLFKTRQPLFPEVAPWPQQTRSLCEQAAANRLPATRLPAVGLESQTITKAVCVRV